MCVIEEVVRLLEDGGWHSLERIRSELGLTEARSQEILAFLCKFKIVDLDKKQERVKLDLGFLELPV